MALIAITTTATATKYRRQAADVCMVDSVTSNPSQDDVKASIDQWNIDVFFNSTGLSGRETVLADVESVVGGVDYICILEDLWGCLKRVREPSYEGQDQLIDGLQGADSLAVEVVQVFNGGRVELLES